ncbi:PREDICTED: uncharacterized protein LOC108765353 [Trachymyrmex cornetzi]|uniref:uncharacterized protein LOC108765353 n=1 Tax=Trachymyrmex cornetzi TaxID=471704 RepID=UPI00084F25F9|nr:PREDICTED: uncharacterized protein LOC108765353 [Trachymyrmex cornetzi]
MVACYADDTIVLAVGGNWEEARLKANEALHSVVEKIHNLGLQVALEKTEAVGFHRKGWQAGLVIRVADMDIRLTQTMNYLGLLLDRRPFFEDHFARVTKKTERAALSLNRLMPNLGGLGSKARRLFANIIASIALYASPVWVDEVKKRCSIRNALRAAQRRIAGRVIHSYSTVSHAVNTALAGTPPLELVAEFHSETYFEISELKDQMGPIVVTPDLVNRVREQGKLRMFDKWRLWIAASDQRGDKTILAVQDCLKNWVEARIGSRIVRRKETSERCWHCNEARDTASHTLECPAWAIQRASLREVVGQDLSLSAIIKTLLNEEGRKAFLAFAEDVMRKKEASERAREGNLLSEQASRTSNHLEFESQLNTVWRFVQKKDELQHGLEKTVYRRWLGMAPLPQSSNIRSSSLWGLATPSIGTGG